MNPGWQDQTTMDFLASMLQAAGAKAPVTSAPQEQAPDREDYQLSQQSRQPLQFTAQLSPAEAQLIEEFRNKRTSPAELKKAEATVAKTESKAQAPVQSSALEQLLANPQQAQQAISMLQQLASDNKFQSAGAPAPEPGLEGVYPEQMLLPIEGIGAKLAQSVLPAKALEQFLNTPLVTQLVAQGRIRPAAEAPFSKATTRAYSDSQPLRGTQLLHPQMNNANIEIWR